MAHATEAQDLEFPYRIDAEFFAEPAVGQTIDLSLLIMEILTPDGVTVLLTLTQGNGITANSDPPGIQIKFATDHPDLKGVGQYQYQIRIPTLGSRGLVAWGHLLLWRK